MKFKKSYFAILVLFIILFHYPLFAKETLNIDLYNSVSFNKGEAIVDLNRIASCLQKGANPNWVKQSTHGGMKYYRTILDHYISTLDFDFNKNQKVRSDATKALKLLFKNGAKVSKHDETILYFPISSGWAEAVELLLKNGSNATFWKYSKVGTKLTPIQIAYQNGHFDIAKILTRYGAKKESKQNIIQLQFLEACHAGSITSIKNLLEKGAAINTELYGYTPLFRALDGLAYEHTPLSHEYSSFDIINLLLDKGADVNMSIWDENGKITALQKIIKRRLFYLNNKKFSHFLTTSQKLIEKMLTLNAHVSVKNRFGQTPLHIASQYSDIQLVKMLIKHNAKIMPTDDFGRTPLDLAESGQIIKLLKDVGATEF